MNYDYLFKCIIVGDATVGKSSILYRFTNDKFNEDYDITIGVDFGSKMITTLDNKILKLQIWDTAGQESFKSITRAYYRGAVIAFIVYDVSNNRSFENIIKWLKDVKSYSDIKGIVNVLIANKIDKYHEVDSQKGKALADENNMLFFETSAKTGINVNKIFIEAGETLYQKIIKNQIEIKNISNGVQKKGYNYDQYENKCCS